MPVRESMSELIKDVRRKIGDDASPTQVFTDEDIQSVLDTTRRQANYQRLNGVIKIAPGGNVTYELFESPWGGFWETSGELVDASYNVITTTDASNALTGQWYVDARGSDDVLFNGWQYDVAQAAADLLEEWLAKVKREYAFTSGNRSFERDRQLRGFEAAIKHYRARQWIALGTFSRTDEVVSRE
jgi:hypothetical protein